jgi:hypothetical protein
MTRRKGEITRAVIKRQWPYRVELPAEAVRGLENSAATWGFAASLGAASYPLSDFHDDRHYTVFHFKTAADAETFAARFDGKVLPPVPPGKRR